MAQHGRTVKVKADLFVELSQSRGLARLARLALAARQGPLTAMILESRRPSSQHKTPAAGTVRDECHGNRRQLGGRILDRLDTERFQVRTDPVAQPRTVVGGVSRHDRAVY
jgi:hypothetical protein